MSVFEVPLRSVKYKVLSLCMTTHCCRFRGKPFQNQRASSQEDELFGLELFQVVWGIRVRAVVNRFQPRESSLVRSKALRIAAMRVLARMNSPRASFSF